MKKVYILAPMLLIGQSSWAQIREFQTTRLHSTAGAGLASVLSTEATVLIPAASAFFNGTSFAYQSYSTSLRQESNDRDATNDDFPSRDKSQGAFASDNTGPVKGGLAYLSQDENNYERQTMVAQAAAGISESAALGFAYKYIQDKKPKGSSNRHDVSHQLTTGYTQVLDESTTIALVLIDPTQATPNEERIIGGFQYVFAQKLTLIGDVGTQYTKDAKDKYLWRAALQLQLFDDFFIRGGKFYDNIREEKGTGWGVGWIGPKLGVEFAQRFSEQFGKDSYIYEGETLVDTSISAVIKF